MEDPKFQRATKTDVLYTGKINGRTYVVPHSFDDHGSTKAMRHSIVVNPVHVAHNNPGLSPEEIARVSQHIKNIHGGQDAKTLEEERQMALHLGMTKTDKVTPEAPVVKKPAPHVSTKSAEEKEADHVKYRDMARAKRHADLYDSRREATLAFARRKHIIKERTITFGSMKFNKIANGAPITYNSFGKIMKPTTTLKEGRPIRGDVFSHHQTLIAKKTLRMPDAMVGVMGGPNKEEARKHLKKMGWTANQIHNHEHAQFAEGVDMAQEVPEQINELSKDTLKSYTRKAYGDIGHQSGRRVHDRAARGKHPWLKASSADQLKVHTRKEKNRGEGLDRALGKLGLEESAADIPSSGTFNTVKSVILEALRKGSNLRSQSDIDKFARRGRAAKNLLGLPQSLGKLAPSKSKKDYEYADKKTVKEDTQLDESFMATYNRNETANRHTANLVHLAKHFGDEGDQSEAKFYAAELKKHGHNKHHEAGYKLHQKLWPKATAAHLHESVSRKHFQQVADVIKSHPDADKRAELAKHRAGIFKTQNPRFDHARFYAAANAVIKEGRSHDELVAAEIRANRPTKDERQKFRKDLPKDERQKFRKDLPKDERQKFRKDLPKDERQKFRKDLQARLQARNQALTQLKKKNIKEGRSHDELVAAEIRANRPTKDERQKFRKDLQARNQAFRDQIKKQRAAKNLLNLGKPKPSAPVKEEAENPALSKTNAHKVGDKVTPKLGVHKGQIHTVIHVHADGAYNIKPDVKHHSLNKYRQGAVRAQHKDVE